MNANIVGARTLAYLRGEKNLFEERKRLAEVKKKVEDVNLSYWMTGVSKRRVERFWQVVSLLQENSRMSLVEMSRKLKIPVSTLFDTLKEVEKVFHFTIVLGQLFCGACSPVVEEEDPRLFIQHVVVNGGNVDSAFSHPNYLVDLRSCHCNITCHVCPIARASECNPCI